MQRLPIDCGTVWATTAESLGRSRSYPTSIRRSQSSRLEGHCEQPSRQHSPALPESIGPLALVPSVGGVRSSATSDLWRGTRKDRLLCSESVCRLRAACTMGRLARSFLRIQVQFPRSNGQGFRGREETLVSRPPVSRDVASKYVATNSSEPWECTFNGFENNTNRKVSSRWKPSARCSRNSQENCSIRQSLPNERAFETVMVAVQTCGSSGRLGKTNRLQSIHQM